jgi:hypothetical protein
VFIYVPAAEHLAVNFVMLQSSLFHGRCRTSYRESARNGPRSRSGWQGIGPSIR